MYPLLQNATHHVQPADFGLFDQMKKSWYKEVPHFAQRNPNTGIHKKKFYSVFKATWEEVMSPSVLIIAFRKSGIYPLDRKQISNEQLLCSEQSSSETGFPQLVPSRNSSSGAVQAFETLEAVLTTSPRTKLKTDVGWQKAMILKEVQPFLFGRSCTVQQRSQSYRAKPNRKVQQQRVQQLQQLQQVHILPLQQVRLEISRHLRQVQRLQQARNVEQVQSQLCANLTPLKGCSERF